MTQEELNQKLHDIHVELELLQREGKHQDSLIRELKGKEITLAKNLRFLQRII